MPEYDCRAAVPPSFIPFDTSPTPALTDEARPLPALQCQHNDANTTISLAVWTESSQICLASIIVKKRLTGESVWQGGRPDSCTVPDLLTWYSSCSYPDIECEA